VAAPAHDRIGDGEAHDEAYHARRSSYELRPGADERREKRKTQPVRYGPREPQRLLSALIIPSVLHRICHSFSAYWGSRATMNSPARRVRSNDHYECTVSRL
jgi:hypothetical protein